MPGPIFIPPQLPTLSTEPPSGPEWLHEIKHDGYRTLVVIDHGKARAFTRNGYDWTAKYAPIVTACAKLRCQSALIDGEMVVENEHGVSDFAALRSAIANNPSRLVFFAFDLLFLNGQDLRRVHSSNAGPNCNTLFETRAHPCATANTSAAMALHSLRQR